MGMTAEQLKQHIDTTITTFHNTLKEQKDQILLFGQTKEETAKKIEELETNLTQLSNELKEVVRKDGIPMGRHGEALETIGHRFVNSQEYKNMISNRMNTSVPVEIKSFFPKNKYALTSEGATGAGVAAPPYRVPGFINPALPTPRMRDLIPVHPTSQGSIEYVRTTGFYPVYTRLTAATLAAATDLVVESTAGFSAGQQIYVDTDETVRLVDAITDATHMSVTVGLTNAHAIGDRVVSRVAAATGQAQTKPTGEFTDFSLETEAVKTIATSVDIARQALADVGQLESFVNNQLTFEMSYTEEWNMLYGDGTSDQLSGILKDADRQTYDWSAGKKFTIGGVTVKDTQIDTVRRALTMVQLAHYPADGIVMHPRDWEQFELMKGSDAHYIWLQLPTGDGGSRFFQYPVVVTDAIVEGTALVGAFALAVALWDREEANIRASDQHADNFKKNLVSLLAEERVAQTIFRPEAFVEVTFDSEPA